jgi:hypothetical protein
MRYNDNRRITCTAQGTCRVLVTKNPPHGSATPGTILLMCMDSAVREYTPGLEQAGYVVRRAPLVRAEQV